MKRTSHCLILPILLLVSQTIDAQVAERKDSIQYELRPDALEAIRKAFGDQQQMVKPKIDFDYSLPGIMPDSFRIRRLLTLHPYNLRTRYNEDPIYDKMSQEEQLKANHKGDLFGIKGSLQKATRYTFGTSFDGNHILSMLFSPKYRNKKKHQEFLKNILLPLYANEKPIVPDTLGKR